MLIAETEEERAEKVRAYLKAELGKADMTYTELAKRLKKHGFKNVTETPITSKLSSDVYSCLFLGMYGALGSGEDKI